MTDQPEVVCLLPTFNRPGTDRMNLLNEAVESFLRQDYPHKRLFICNDARGQYLDCDAPGVEIANLTYRFLDLGSKIRWMCESTNAPLIARWDDDDISLPHRLSYTVERMQASKLAWEYHAPNYFFLSSYRLHLNDHAANTHITAVWQRSLLAEIGGYPLGQGEDQKFHAAMKAASVWEDHASVPWSEAYYIYRWGVSPHHLSGRPDIQGHWDEMGTAEIPQGTFTIEPRWDRDYAADAAIAARNMAGQ